MRSRLLYQQLPWWVLAHKVSAVGIRGKTWQGISNSKIKSEILLEEKATLSNIKAFRETAQVHLEAKLVGEAGLNPTFAFHWTHSNKAGSTAAICEIRTCVADFQCLLSLQDLQNWLVQMVICSNLFCSPYSCKASGRGWKGWPE